MIKTLLAPKLTYLLTNLPDPSRQLLKEIDSTLFKFLWGGKVSKIKKKQLSVVTMKRGGLKCMLYTQAYQL